MARCGCSGDATCYCRVIAGPNITVTGTGSPGNPYVVSAGAPDCDVIRACFSTLDTATINFEPITGGVITGVVIPDPARAGVVGPNGVGVCLSTDLNNGITYGTDGCLFVAAGEPTPVVAGCGLTGANGPVEPGTIANPLVANVSPAFVESVTGAGFACGVESGSNIFCDPASGQLKGEPTHFKISQKMVQFVTANATPITALDAPGGGGSQVGVGVAFQLTNPSPCRTMILRVTSGIQHALLSQVPGGGNGRTDVEYAAGTTLTAPAVALTPVDNGHQHWAHTDDFNGGRATFDTKGAYGEMFYSLPPGASTVVNMNASFETITSTTAIPANIDGWQNAVIIEGWTI